MTLIIARTDFPQYYLVTKSYGSFEYLHYMDSALHASGLPDEEMMRLLQELRREYYGKQNNKPIPKVNRDEE